MKRSKTMLPTVITLLLLGVPVITGCSSKNPITNKYSEFANEQVDYLHMRNGNSKFERGDYSGAIADYTKAIQLTPGNDDAFYNRGISKRKLGDNKGAIEDYNKALELNP